MNWDLKEEVVLELSLTMVCPLELGCLDSKPVSTTSQLMIMANTLTDLSSGFPIYKVETIISYAV